MFTHCILMLATCALASLLFTGNSAHAQDYFYGYYYPNEHRFKTDQLEGGYIFNTIIPGGDPFSQGSPPAWMKDATIRREPSPASIQLFLPDPQAKVWFD